MTQKNHKPHPSASHLSMAELLHPHIDMLYDSDAYALVRLHAEHRAHTAATPALPRLGYEIVDKCAGKEVYLDGAWAEFFTQDLQVWQDRGSHQDELEAQLERYAQLAQNPVLLH